MTVEELKEEIQLDLQEKIAEMMGVQVEVKESAEGEGDKPAKKRKKRKGKK